MLRREKKTPLILAGCFLSVAFILYVVSNALPSWTQLNRDKTEITFGLWRSCTKNATYNGCNTLDCSQAGSPTGSSYSKILVARAFLTLACIISGIAILCLSLSVITNDNRRQLLLISCRGLTFGCLVVGITGVSVGVGTVIDDQIGQRRKLGPASIIGIAAFIINLFATIAALY